MPALLTEPPETSDDVLSTSAAVSLAPMLLNVEQVGAILGGISARKIRSMVSAGQFPKPLKIDRLSRWRPADVSGWVAKLAA